ncbi:unnamed protein product [Rhizoctonia solani]|uniref:Uncharacterized protein n=1 Tax=Rhizoctonia solani TaxID=456999 RepID=A0A8H3C1F4_9AGAM|nr:unnamed protein product [Rhizoctonia solani]
MEEDTLVVVIFGVFTLITADNSAATIVAEGLFILSAAENYLLVNNFEFAFKPTWDSILSNGTSYETIGNKDGGLTYGDYCSLQVGNSMLKLGLASC